MFLALLVIGQRSPTNILRRDGFLSERNFTCFAEIKFTRSGHGNGLMSIFVVSIVNPSGLAGSIASSVETFGQPFMKISDTTYLLSHDGAARQLADDLGVTAGNKGTAIVTEVASYWGRGDPGIWTWMEAHWGKRSLNG